MVFVLAKYEVLKETLVYTMKINEEMPVKVLFLKIQ